MEYTVSPGSTRWVETSGDSAAAGVATGLATGAATTTRGEAGITGRAGEGIGAGRAIGAGVGATSPSAGMAVGSGRGSSVSGAGAGAAAGGGSRAVVGARTMGKSAAGAASGTTSGEVGAGTGAGATAAATAAADRVSPQPSRSSVAACWGSAPPFFTLIFTLTLVPSGAASRKATAVSVARFTSTSLSVGAAGRARRSRAAPSGRVRYSAATSRGRVCCSHSRRPGRSSSLRDSRFLTKIAFWRIPYFWATSKIVSPGSST